MGSTQQSHRLQEGNSGYQRGGLWEGGSGGREMGTEGYIFSTHGVRGHVENCSTEQANSESVASYYIDGQ